MFTPLDQFEIIYVYMFRFSYLRDFSLTNSNVFFFFAGFLLFFFFFFCYWNSLLIPSFLQFLIESFSSFVKTLVLENIGSVYVVYFSFIFSIFGLVFMSNFLGMVIYTFTVTSHLVTTFGLAFLGFIGLTLIGILKHGLLFLSLFLPHGAPLFIAPFLIVIEVISYIARVFSLSIRLFANMMSGHTLLKILSNFVWLILWSFAVGNVLFILPFFIVVVVTLLEMAIAFLQSYVFTTLMCLYLNDVFHLH